MDLIIFLSLFAACITQLFSQILKMVLKIPLSNTITIPGNTKGWQTSMRTAIQKKNSWSGENWPMRLPLFITIPIENGCENYLCMKAWQTGATQNRLLKNEQFLNFWISVCVPDTFVHRRYWKWKSKVFHYEILSNVGIQRVKNK